jgi:ATP-dependent Clp protease protease subunit
MLHQPHIYGGGIQGQVTDIEIEARELTRVKEEMNEILASHTGQDLETVSRDTDRNFWMSSKEAKAYGVVDTVLEPRELKAVTG